MRQKTIKFTKKNKVILITAIVLAVLIAATLVIKNVATGGTVETVPVSTIELGWWNGGETTAGTVTTDFAQNVSLEDTDIVKKMLVKAGDPVKIGTPLLEYDVTLLDLELTGKEFDLRADKTSLEIEQRRLEKMRKNRTSGSSNKSTFFSWIGKAIGGMVNPESSEVSGTESGEVSGTESGEVSGTESSEVSGTESSEVSGTESSEVSGAESSEVSGTESSEVSGTESSEPSGESSQPDPEPQFPDIKLQEDVLIEAGDGTEKNPFYYRSSSFRLTSAFMDAWTDYTKAQQPTDPAEEGKDVYVKIGRYLFGDESKEVKIILMLQFKADGTMEFDFEILPDPPTPPESSEPSSEPESSEPSSAPESSEPSSKPESAEPSSKPEASKAEPKPPVVKPLPPTPEPGDRFTDAQINEQESKVKSLELDIKLSELGIKKLQKRYDDSTVYSTVNGVVKTVTDPKEAGTSEPIVTVTGSEGYYIKGTIGEFAYQTLQVGQKVTVMTWESGVSCEGSIVEIQPYPISGDEYGYYGEGNNNISRYPFVVAVPSDQPLIEHESAEIAIVAAGNSQGGLYISKAYTRDENNRTYVLVDQEGVLEKRYITTGKVMYGEYIEILNGLSKEDSVAFPYGAKVKEGMKTKAPSDDTVAMKGLGG